MLMAWLQVALSMKRRVRWADQVADEGEEEPGFSIGGASRQQVPSLVLPCSYDTFSESESSITRHYRCWVSCALSSLENELLSFHFERA